MSLPTLITLSLILRLASARVLGRSAEVWYPTTKPPSRREENAALPTFTFGPENVYFPPTATNPEPSGSEIQVYPTGVYDSVPTDGITIAFGPEIREQVDTVRAQNCNNRPADECRMALNDVMQKTDVSTHVKRFIPLAAWAFGVLLGLVITEIIYVYNHDLGKGIKFRPEDLQQIHSMAGAQEIAIMTASDASAVAATLTYQPPATTTATSLISIETLTTASNGHEAGDAVYHIPENTAESIQDFLGMTGLQETQQICKGQKLKRADPTEECIKRILRHAMDLVDTGPENLMALAQANIPMEPAAGQPIGFPIPDISIGDSMVFIQVYRQIFSATAQAPQIDQNWDPSVLIKSAVGLTIAAHAAMFAGQGLLQIFVSKNDIVTDLREEDLACAKDLICRTDDCQGQKEVTDPLTRMISSEVPLTPTCLTPRHLGCRCEVVNYPYVYEVPKGYMDAQYAWLEELIKLAENPVPEATGCKDNLQRLDDLDPRATFENWIEKACAEHDNRVDRPWNWNYYDTPAFVGSLRWSQVPDGLTECPFDCKTALAPFLDSDCVKDEGFSSTGRIDTVCGRASLYTRDTACRPEHPECCVLTNSHCGEVD